jgi:hypothetical protein
MALVVKIGFSQTRINKYAYDTCVPSILGWFLFDTNGCKKQVDTVNGMKSVLQIDSSGNRYFEQFTLGDSHLYYQHDTNTYLMRYNLENTKVFIYFWNNGLIHVMNFVDSCKVSEIRYDKIGNVTQQFYCDYSKPDDCYLKDYLDGKIYTESLYTPFAFKQLSESDLHSLNSFCKEMKIVPLKMIFFKDGKFDYEINVDLHPKY